MWFLLNGVDIGLAAKQMGHSPDIMMKIYARLPIRDRAKREATHIEFGKRRDFSHIVDVDEID